MENEPGTRLVLPAQNVRSLCFRGDTLVDLLSWLTIYRFDGTTERANKYLDYSCFDAATLSPSGRHGVVYKRLGTKGVVVKENFVVREINRSYYHAEEYEYPICLFALPNGREVIAHCPEEYNRIEIDDLKTGERLTARLDAVPNSFHSRLAASATGASLLSTGWAWPPSAGDVEVYDVVAMLSRRPNSKEEGMPADRDRFCFPFSCDFTSATFLNDESIVASYTTSVYSGGVAPNLRVISVFRKSDEAEPTPALLEDDAGMLMPVGDDWVVGFYDHPKLIHYATGRVVYHWSELKTGRQTSSLYRTPLPPLALDPVQRRFAVAGPDSITVMTVTPPDAPPAVAATAIQ